MERSGKKMTRLLTNYANSLTQHTHTEPTASAQQGQHHVDPARLLSSSTPWARRTNENQPHKHVNLAGPPPAENPMERKKKIFLAIHSPRRN